MVDCTINEVCGPLLFVCAFTVVIDRQENVTYDEKVVDYHREFFFDDKREPV